MPKILAAFLSLLLLVVAAILFFWTLPRLGALPQGERLERVEASPHYRGGYFHNIVRGGMVPLPRELASQKTRNHYKAVWNALVGGGNPEDKPRNPLPVVKTDWDSLPRERDCIVWFGHSSYMVQLGGKRILVDPVFGTASPVPGINRPFPGTDAWSADELPAVDVLLITHDHYDHLDYATVRALRERVGMVICPLGVGAHFEFWGYEPERIHELDWGECVQTSGLCINAHTAYHYSGRNFNTRRRALWASYVLQGNGRTLYLGGDSGYAAHLAVIGQQYGGVDYAVVENGQYSPNWATNHTLPHELPLVLRDLGARRVLTVHHSKYKLSPHPWKEPLENALKLHESGVSVDIPRIGEPVYLDAPPVVSHWWRSE